MNGDFELELFTEALREDLPSARDEARLRVRLASAGILAGAGIITPAATAAATGTATAGVFAKVVALPLALKVGMSLALAGVAVVPLVHSRLRTLGAPAEVSRPTARQVAVPLLPRTTETRASTPAVVPAASAAQTASPASFEPKRAEAASAVAAEVGARALNRAAREGASARNVGGSPVAPATPSLSGVGAFPVAPAASEDEGTLRAETALMERALAAMQQGDFKTARRELTLHAAQFPNGHLAPERDRALARIRETEKTP